jgi:hypothetical protein
VPIGLHNSYRLWAKERLCFGPRAFLNFHQARNGSVPSRETTQWMFDHYPADIRGWIVAKGGLEKMPFHEFWTLPAKELWQMGYGKCVDLSIRNPESEIRNPDNGR